MLQVEYISRVIPLSPLQPISNFPYAEKETYLATLAAGVRAVGLELMPTHAFGVRTWRTWQMCTRDFRERPQRRESAFPVSDAPRVAFRYGG